MLEFVVILYIFLLFFHKSFFKIASIATIPFVHILISLRIKKNLEDKERYTERFGLSSIQRPRGRIIWIHATSVGEVISIIPFVHEIINIDPNINILLTTTTLTGKNMAIERLGSMVIHQFIPFDVFPWVERFIKYWSPDVVCLVESEIWPNILYHLDEKKIPTYLINARISRKSLKRMMFFKRFFRILPYKLFKIVFTPSEWIYNDIKNLGGKDVRIIPNIKLIAQKLPVSSLSANISKNLHGRKCWIAASTHPGEEELVIKAHKKLSGTIPQIITIIAPRHVNRVNDVFQLLDGMNASIYPSENIAQLKDHIYIVDKMGILGDFFDVIKTVFVGGSLIEGIGGHNFVEPMRFGCKVATGKFIENFDDIYDVVKCKKVAGVDELVDFVYESLTNETPPHQMEDFIENHKKLWKRAIEEILS